MIAGAFASEHHPSWCPGCGNFAIRTALIGALEDLGRAPGEICIVSGIGQAAKMPHYLKVSFFNGLHGRALPVASAVKAANPRLVVIAEGGDGDMYGEGGNHFLHAIRRNPDIALLVHDNMVYGLTKGQASPTSRLGMVTPVQVEGVGDSPFNPLAIAIALDAPFVARALSGDIERTREIIRQAILHPGLALVDILQPCPSFNKTNTLRSFRERSYELGPDHDPGDRTAAMAVALDEERFALGVLYRHDRRTSWERRLPAYRTDGRPLPERPARIEEARAILRERRSG